MLNQLQVTFLQRLVESMPENKQASETASRLAEHFGIGMRQGRRVIYGPADFEGARKLLEASGMPLKAAGAEASRAGRSIYPGLSEKTGSQRPHDDSVAIRGASGRVEIGTAILTSEPGCYLVATVEQAARCGADRVMVVENLETFRWLNRQGWIDYAGGRTLAVFRGDTATSPGDCNRFLSTVDLPVWGFFDFDPAGLGMAAGIDRLERLVLPGRDWLVAQARKERRTDLFHASLQQWEQTIASCCQKGVGEAWLLMRELGCGLPQEWMEGGVGMM